MVRDGRHETPCLFKWQAASSTIYYLVFCEYGTRLTMQMCAESMTRYRAVHRRWRSELGGFPPVVILTPGEDVELGGAPDDAYGAGQ